MTNDEEKRLREVEKQMAVLTEQVSNVEARVDNHGERLGCIEDAVSGFDVRLTKVETSIEVGKSNRNWTIATFLSVLMAIVAVVGLFLRMKH